MCQGSIGEYTENFFIKKSRILECLPTDPSSQLCVYRFKVVPFGATSSPFMLNAVLQYHLRQYSTPVSLDMCSNLYVDNIITGCDVEQDVVNYYREARAIMCDARLNLRSWSSNSVALTTIATKDNTAEKAVSVNILGLRWIPGSDKLHLAAKPSILTNDHLVTKREILQDLSKVFDPLGFVAPVVIRAKMLMQILWQLKVTWNEPLQENIQAQWKDIAGDLKTATAFSVSRCYFIACMTCPVVHCFVDASKHAYGAVVFLTQGNEVSFVAAKTRVAPLKTLTIPRLELMAALVGTRVTHFVNEAIPVSNSLVFMWSDSQIVLHWIKSQKPLRCSYGTVPQKLIPYYQVSIGITALLPITRLIFSQGVPLPKCLCHHTYGNMAPSGSQHQTIGHLFNHHICHQWFWQQQWQQSLCP